MNGDQDQNKSTDTADSGDSVERLLRIAGPRSNPPAWMEYEVRAAVRQAWLKGQRAAARKRRIGWFALAASLLLAGGLALRFDAGLAPAQAGNFGTLVAVQGEVWQGDGDGSGEHTSAAVAGSRLRLGAELRTGNGRLSILREDGMSLRFDADSVVRLEETGSIYLAQGAVYLDSGAAGTGEKSIAVVTPMGIARNFGTQYELRLRDQELSLRVREGRVTFAGPARQIEARAGEALTLAGDGNLQRSTIAPHAPAWQWAQTLAPAFDIDGRPVIEFLQWAARETGMELRFGTPAARDAASLTRLSGTIRGFAPADAVSPVLATTRFSFEFANGVLRVDLPPADL